MTAGRTARAQLFDARSNAESYHDVERAMGGQILLGDEAEAGRCLGAIVAVGECLLAVFCGFSLG
jgi:hypothetical protein